MFGPEAPIWQFLAQFGGPADPLRLQRTRGTQIVETYPVLLMIALMWMLQDTRPTGRLPKYNPERRTTFSISDWQHVCQRAAEEYRERRLETAVRWLEDASRKAVPRKSDQDCLDAYLCLLVAMHFAQQRDCLMIGDSATGYIVVPYGAGLLSELEIRCKCTSRTPSDWLRVFRASIPRTMVLSPPSSEPDRTAHCAGRD